MELQSYYPVLRSTSLLRGAPDAMLDALLPALCPRTRSYQKGEILLLAGYEAREVGLILEGRITAAKSMPDGSTMTVTHMGPGGVFGDVLAGSGTRSPVNVTAASDCLVLYLPRERLLHPGDAPPELHWQVLRNLVETISHKYFLLDRRLELLMCRSLRARISLWLLDEAAREGCETFTVPLTRAELADYLGCDRSALSRELSRMQHDGLVETWRGSFKLLDKEGLQGSAREESHD